MKQREEVVEIVARNDPAMNRDEVVAFVCDVLIADIEIKTVLEIGVHRCGSFGVWAAAFQPCLIIGVDNNLQAGEMHAALGLPGYIVAPVWSQEPATVQRVTELLAGRRVDFLFIDGGHLEREVRGDVAGYFPLLNRPAVVGFHDILASIDGVCDVPVVWAELKTQYAWREYSAGHYGIGALFLWN